METIPEALKRLHPEHQFRRIYDGRYVPREATDVEQLRLARPAVLKVLIADAPHVEDPDEQPHFSSSRRGRSILRYGYFQAGEDPDALEPSEFLDPDRVRAWGAWLVRSGVTHGSADHMVGDVLSFQRAFPLDFRPRRKRKRRQPQEPNLSLPDGHFALGMKQAEAIVDSDYRAQAMAQLLLNRGAGASNVDSRYVAGLHVEDRGPIGTWVVFTAPGREREVPVVRRFAAPLQALASQRPNRSLIGAGTGAVPARRPQPVDMLRDLNLRLRARGHMVSITTERLRKAWMLEIHRGGASLGTVAALSCITSTAHLSWLLAEDPPPSDPEELARLVGAIPRGGNRT